MEWNFPLQAVSRLPVTKLLCGSFLV